MKVAHKHHRSCAPLVMAMPVMFLAIGGCARESQPGANAASVDINGTAEQAQGDIDTYESNALQTPREAAANSPLPPPVPSPTPTPVASATPLAPPGPGEPGGLPDDRTPVSEAPFTPESAQGAANVVQTYYALIGAGKYHQAWSLWDNGGAASGMSAAAFAASFDKYAAYHANVGAPGRIDAGAGQRYVTVPVQAYGTLTNGSAFNLRGDVTLHRAGDIDGATAAQKAWHINTTNLKQTPSTGSGGADQPSSTIPARAAADYTCADGYAFHIDFDNRAANATMRVGAKQVAVLNEQPVGSGISYRGEGYSLRGKGNSADLRRPGRSATSCSAG